MSHFDTQGYNKTMGKGASVAGMSLIKHSVPKWKSLELEMSIAVPYTIGYKGHEDWNHNHHCDSNAACNE